MIKLSIIVPVYNVEKYVSRCINSILEQTFSDFELILINDGSTDKSGQICDEYSKADSRISVVHKGNEGPSIARNIGIKAVKGKYLCFVDSDDFVAKHSYEALINEAETNSLDIVCGNGLIYYDENNNYLYAKKRQFPSKVYNGVDFYYNSVKEGAMAVCVPFNVYRTEFIRQNSLFFEEHIAFEDELWTPQVFLKAKKVKYIDITFYMYFKREGSRIATEVANNKDIFDIVNICYKLEELYSQVDDKKQRYLFNETLFYMYLNAFVIGNFMKPGEINKKFLIGKAKSLRCKVKLMIFLINKRLYRNLTLLIRRSKGER